MTKERRRALAGTIKPRCARDNPAVVTLSDEHSYLPGHAKRRPRHSVCESAGVRSEESLVFRHSERSEESLPLLPNPCACREDMPGALLRGSDAARSLAAHSSTRFANARLRNGRTRMIGRSQTSRRVHDAVYDSLRTNTPAGLRTVTSADSCPRMENAATKRTGS